MILTYLFCKEGPGVGLPRLGNSHNGCNWRLAQCDVSASMHVSPAQETRENEAHVLGFTDVGCKLQTLSTRYSQRFHQTRDP
jgi:hypothetical protein